MHLGLVCAVVLLVGVTAEVAYHEPCDKLSPEALSSCSVSQVRITPCANPKSCNLVKGTIASIDFDFTPNFSATNLTTGLFWAKTRGDIPFGNLYEANGCDYTSCPLESGKTQVLNYRLKLGLKLPTNKYIFKWKLWNAENENEVCCFRTTVRLLKPKI